MSYYFAYHQRQRERLASSTFSDASTLSPNFYAQYAQRSPWDRVLHSWQHDENSFLCVTTGIGECYGDDNGQLLTRVLAKWEVMEKAGVLAPLTDHFGKVYLVHFDPLGLAPETELGMTLEEQQTSLANIGAYLTRSEHKPLFVQQPFTPALYTLLRQGTGKTRHLIFDFAHVVSKKNRFDTTLYSRYFTDKQTENKKEYVVRFGYMGDYSAKFVRALVEDKFLYRISVDTNQTVTISTLLHRLYTFYNSLNYAKMTDPPTGLKEPIDLLARYVIKKIKEFFFSVLLKDWVEKLNPEVLKIDDVSCWKEKILALLLENVWNDDPEKQTKDRDTFYNLIAHMYLTEIENENLTVAPVSSPSIVRPMIKHPVEREKKSSSLPTGKKSEYTTLLSFFKSLKLEENPHSIPAPVSSIITPPVDRKKAFPSSSPSNSIYGEMNKGIRNFTGFFCYLISLLQALLRLSSIKAEISNVANTGECHNLSEPHEYDPDKKSYECLFCYFVRIAKAQTQEELKTIILSMYTYVNGGTEFWTQSDSIDFLFSKLMDYPFGHRLFGQPRLNRQIFSCNMIPHNMPTLDWKTNIPEVYLPSLPHYLTPYIKTWLANPVRKSYTQFEQVLTKAYFEENMTSEAYHDNNVSNIMLACANELKIIFENAQGKSLTWGETAQLLNDQMNDSKGATLNLEVTDIKEFEAKQYGQPKVLVFQNGYLYETGERRWIARIRQEGLSYVQKNVVLFPNEEAIQKLYTAAIPLRVGQYELKSVLIKYGGRTGGHYVCSVKENSRWVFYNDGNIPEVHQTETNYWSYDKLLTQAQKGRQVIPMVFFYEKNG